MNKIIRLLTIFSIISVLSVSYGLTSYSFSAFASKRPPAKSVVKTNSKILVYYFYSKPRCSNCKKIESYTKEAVESINSSDIEYKLINLDDKENQHYAKDYNLFTKSVILSKLNNGKQVKWKNLDGIWTKLNNEKAFKDYVTKEIKSF